MRKFYLSVASVLVGVTSFGQVNLSYEEPVTHPAAPQVPELGSTVGWEFGIYEQSTDATNGTYSLELKTATNPLFANFQLPTTVPGQVFQTVAGPFANNGADITGSVDFKFTQVGGDTALLIFEVYDTLGVGFSDDILLYTGSLAFNQSVTNWQTVNFTLQATGESGTANELYFGGLSGYQSFNNGSTLWLDNWVIDLGNGSVGIEDIAIEKSFTAFPNPATDILNVTAAEEITTVSILSLDGKLVSTVNGGKVDVSNLTSGVYIYEATTVSGQKAINKFVKK